MPETARTAARVACFLAAAPVDARAGLAADATLGARLDAWIARGRAAFPTLAVDDDALAAWLGARVGAASPLPPDDRVPAEDHYLACACAGGADAAVEQLATRHLPRLAPALRHAGLADADLAEIEQALVTLLFVGDGGPPHITTYAGRGDLHGWLKAIAVRLALRRRDRDRRHVGDDALADVAAGAPGAVDPRLAHWQRTAAAELGAAVAAAIATLPVADRTLLRQHHLDGVTLDQLAAHAGVHRATIARRLAAARRTVADRARDDLVRRLGVDPDEVDSVVRLVQSQLDVSLRRHLA
ncbi:MAG: hypothetical protein H6708_02805 [Kofleriaceae bacterium]|nr:hypothetical protein [Kofleriaceae bacterium]